MINRILSIDGGGMRGYLPCSMLEYLENKTGLLSYQMFGSISGTSIGGILACLLASGQPASEAKKFFTEDGPVIFKPSSDPARKDGILKSRYESGPIEDVLHKRLGQLRMTDLKVPIVVPSFDLASGHRYIFHSGSENWWLWQVARATSAAQSYFPAFRVLGRVLWDGGIVANNPSAFAEAFNYNDLTTDYRIVSLGCGEGNSGMSPAQLENAEDFGIVKVAEITFAGLFANGPHGVDDCLGMRLGDRYVRMQPTLTKDLPIDGASPADLVALEDAAQAALRQFQPQLDALAAEFSPKG